MRWLYTAGVWIYGLGIRLVALWNVKAKKWVDGRKISSNQSLRSPLWVHCASVGEFEQGRPIIEALKQRHPDLEVLLTFFSPSGYDMRKDYPFADVVTYIPLDIPRRIRQFIRTYQPCMAIFIKYEVWHNTFYALQKAGVPVVMASAKFRSDQVYFKPWGKWFLRTLKHATHLYTQDEHSARLLRNHGLTAVTCAGDTRFDRVAQIAAQQAALPEVEAFKGSEKLVVAGSTWPKDEEMIAGWWLHNPMVRAGWKLIIVPHELHRSHLEALSRSFPKASLWSNGDFAESDVLIADVMGLLSRIYRYAEVAYVGGGFGAGIHNTLEPAVYGCPVIFGPRHEKFVEAAGLLAAGAAVAVSGPDGFARAMEGFALHDEKRTAASEASKRFVENGQGATDKVVEMVEAYLYSGT